MLPIVRNAVRVILLNQRNELLLMCVEDFDISTIEGSKNKRFWCTVGGGIEEGESIEQAALREIHEEAGIAPEEIELGPVVWQSSVDLMLKGKLTTLAESFIVAKTNTFDVKLHMPTEDEKQTVKKLHWFSLNAIQTCPDKMFPERLAELLPPILAERYPEKPIIIS